MLEPLINPVNSTTNRIYRLADIFLPPYRFQHYKIRRRCTLDRLTTLLLRRACDLYGACCFHNTYRYNQISGYCQSDHGQIHCVTYREQRSIKSRELFFARTTWAFFSIFNRYRNSGVTVLINIYFLITTIVYGEILYIFKNPLFRQACLIIVWLKHQVPLYELTYKRSPGWTRELPSRE